MYATKDWTIQDIESLTEQEARDMALETLTLHGHSVYLVDFDGYFGYSALVFRDGRHIKYANDYELHHSHWLKTREALRQHFIGSLNTKLFTDDELVLPLHDYMDYKRRAEYLHNYYGLLRDYVTIFCINPTEEQERAFKERTASMTYDPVAFAYFDDAAFVEHHIALYKALDAVYEKCLLDYGFLKSAIKYEMANHEYAINWQGNYDTLGCFGNIRFNDPDDPKPYLRQLGWTPDQCRAFWDARREYVSENSDNY